MRNQLLVLRTEAAAAKKITCELRDDFTELLIDNAKAVLDREPEDYSKIDEQGDQLQQLHEREKAFARDETNRLIAELESAKAQIVTLNYIIARQRDDEEDAKHQKELMDRELRRVSHQAQEETFRRHQAEDQQQIDLCRHLRSQRKVTQADVECQSQCTYTSVRGVVTPRFLPLPESSHGAWAV